MAYDVIICGAGPAGLSAAIYAGRYGLSTLVLEKLFAGGQLSITPAIENYPGLTGSVSGLDLAQNMQRQAENFGAKLQIDEIKNMDLTGAPKQIQCAGGVYEAHAVILALGSHPRTLGLPREEELTGHGVSYCAECDGFFFKGKTVCVVGGGETAALDAVHLGTLCKKVYVIHRRDAFRASKFAVDRLRALPNVEFVLNAQVSEMIGDTSVQGVRIRQNGEERILKAEGLFVAVGTVPNTGILQDKVALSDGYIVTDGTPKTGVPGVFAAGDAVSGAFRQAITAAASGALAAHLVQEYLLMV